MCKNQTNDTDSRLVLIGLDGTPCSMLRTLIDTGVMPCLGKITADGGLLRMNSSVPEVSSVAWSSMMTGANPAVHGIYGFTELSPGSYDLSFPDFRDLRAEPFWARLNRAGKRCVVINMPSTYPAPSMEGVLVSGFVAIDIEQAVCPANLVGRLTRMDYRIDVDSELAHENIDAFLDDLFVTLERRVEFYRQIWDEEHWHMFALVVTGTDRLHHFLHAAIEDENHPFHQRSIDYYARVDELVGEVSDRMRDDDSLLLMSDHGFARLRTEAYVNSYLAETGMLKMKARPGTYLDIDEGTLAFAMDPCRIYLNRRGEFPRGCVEGHDEASILKDIRSRLTEWTYEGEPVLADVFARDEVYDGPLIDRAPDLVARAKPGIDPKATLRKTDVFGKNVFSGMHTGKDAFLAWRGLDPQVGNDPMVSDVHGIIMRHFGLD